MPKQKLTLSVDERLVRRAKRFSEKHETSVSQLVSDFLETLEDEPSTGSIVESLRGIQRTDGAWLDHKEHLRKKYLG